MPLFGSTEIFSSIKQALLGTQATSLDSMIEKLFPSEVTARISQTNGSSGTPSYAPLGILAFEAAAAMNRGVELWEALQLPKLTKLRQNLEVSNHTLIFPEIVKTLFLFISFSVRRFKN